MKRLIDFFRGKQAPSAPPAPALHCRPGDVARVVKDGSLASVVLWGRVVTVRELARNGDREPAWTYEGPPMLVVILSPIVVEVIPDSMLRPITPPAGTVTDEEVRDLYAPKQTEHA